MFSLAFTSIWQLLPAFPKMLFMEHCIFPLEKNTILCNHWWQKKCSADMLFFQPWWNIKETSGSSIHWDYFVTQWWRQTTSVWTPREGPRSEATRRWFLSGVFSLVMIFWCLLTRPRCQYCYIQYRNIAYFSLSYFNIQDYFERAFYQELHHIIFNT